MIPRLALLTFVILLSGCSAFKEAPPTPSDSLVDQQTGVSVNVVWSVDAGAGAKFAAEHLVPGVDGGRVYTADKKGTVSCYAAKDGKRIWRVDTDRPISSGPGIGKDLLTFGTLDGNVLGLDKSNGKTLWISGVTSEVLSTPAVSGDTVVARSGDGRVFGLRASDGARRWIYDRTPPALTLRGAADPVIADGMALVGMDSGKLPAIDLETGRASWEADIGIPHGASDLDRMVDVDGTPVVSGDQVFAVSYQGRLLALSLETGRTIWERDLSSWAGLAVDRHQVYVTDAKDRVWAFDRSNGASVWRQDQFQGLRVTAPVVFGNYVVVADDAGRVSWLSRNSGKIVARVDIGGGTFSDAPISQAPVVAGDRLYVLDMAGNLKAVAAKPKS